MASLRHPLFIAVAFVALTGSYSGRCHSVVHAETFVDTRGLEFLSQEAFCGYHCAATHAKQAYRHLRELSECTVENCGDFLHERRRKRRVQLEEEPIKYRRLDESYNFSGSTLDGGSASVTGDVHAAANDDDDKDVQVVNFMSCSQLTDSEASTKSIALAIGDPETNAFSGFYDAFFEAYDAMISSANASYDACQLQFLQEALLSNYTDASNETEQVEEEDADSIQPILIKFNTTYNELECVAEVRTIWTTDDEAFTPFLTRSDQEDANTTIMLIHTTTAIGEEILELDCVESATVMPPIIKLTPFARSSVSLSRNSISEEGPPLEIRLVRGSNYYTALTRLQQEITSAVGITNVLTQRGDDTDSRILDLVALEEFSTWAEIVSIILEDSAVEWLDLKVSITTGALRPRQSLEQKLMAMPADDFVGDHNMHNRRLDDYIQDLVGVTAMQEHNITGTNIIVGITDTGLYIDHDQFDQESRDMYDAVDTTARKVIMYQTFANQYDEAEAIVCGHGTHVSGILAGSSYSGTQKDLGIASNARIAFMDIGKQSSSCAGQSGCDVSLETPGEVEDLMQDQVLAGATIYSFSWGTGGNDYNTQSRDLDDYVYNNPEILIVVAAGNSGDDGSFTISSPSGAKNVISVGASLNDEASFSSTPCPSVLNKYSVASFSSIGPTLDGRMKPDVVAPGMTIESSQSQKPGSTTKTTSLCDLQGTSQATPVVAGMAVLLYEWLRDGWWKNGVADASYGMETIPSALLKALIIHSGEALTRRLMTPETSVTSCVALEKSAELLTSYPDFNQGYGKPTLNNIATFADAASNATGGGVYFFPNSTAGSEPSVSEGTNMTFNFLLQEDANLRVTVVWTDPAGSVGSKITLQNDLDLSVRIPNTDAIFYPMAGNGTRDSKNNVEMVEVSYDDVVAAMEASGLTVEESADVIVQAVVYGYSVKAGSSSSQTFALVASSSPSVESATSAESSSEDEFWQPWMTIGAIIIGTLAVLMLIGLIWRVRFSKESLEMKHQRGHGRNIRSTSHTHPNYRREAGGTTQTRRPLAPQHQQSSGIYHL